MKNGWLAVSRREMFFAIISCLLLTAFLLTITSEVWAQEGPRPTPSQPNMAGSQGREAKAVQASADDLAREIESALVMGDLTAARRLVPRFLQTPRLTADSLLQIGVNLAQHDLYSEASKVFKRCTKDHPAVFEGFYNLSLAQLALQQPQDALGTVAKAPHASPSEEIARTYLRGKIEVALQQEAEAERDLSAAFTAAPQEENSGLDLGLCYIREEKYQLAAEVFQKALGFQRDSPFLRLGLALAQFLGGLNAESVETCRTLLASQPDFSAARVMMAFALYMQGKIDEAATFSAQGLRDPSPFPYLYYLHAVSLLKLQSKDYDTLVNDLTLAARSIPDCGLCYLALSKVHRRKGDLGTATADLERAVELDPTLAEGWYNLATVYDQAGRHADARSARQRFETIKESKANRETEILRDAFLKTLSGEGSPQKGP
jgi:tetratricopeptide (TPR) repeat protein